MSERGLFLTFAALRIGISAVVFCWFLGLFASFLDERLKGFINTTGPFVLIGGIVMHFIFGRIAKRFEHGARA